MSRVKLTVEHGGDKGGEAPRVWTCHECGREGFWTDEWAWHGSLRDLDDGAYTVICSAECRASLDVKLRGGVTRKRAPLPRQHRSDR